MQNTVNAKGAMPLRSYDYYAKFWNEFSSRGQGRFYFFYEDGQPSVGAFVINYGSKATYEDGGSTQNRKQYGDSHLTQWAAIQRMQELGCVEHDFCGTPSVARIKDKTHPLYGMGLFKTSFIKTVTDLVGCYDLFLSPLRYKLWLKGGEKVFCRLAGNHAHRRPVLLIVQPSTHRTKARPGHQREQIQLDEVIAMSSATVRG